MFNKKFFYEIMSNREIEECMSVNAESTKSKIAAAKGLARWFEVDVEIKIFGVTIFKWHFPPEERKNPPM